MLLCHFGPDGNSAIAVKRLIVDGLVTLTLAEDIFVIVLGPVTTVMILTDFLAVPIPIVEVLTGNQSHALASLFLNKPRTAVGIVLHQRWRHAASVTVNLYFHFHLMSLGIWGVVPDGDDLMDGSDVGHLEYRCVCGLVGVSIVFSANAAAGLHQLLGAGIEGQQRGLEFLSDVLGAAVLAGRSGIVLGLVVLEDDDDARHPASLGDASVAHIVALRGAIRMLQCSGTAARCSAILRNALAQTLLSLSFTFLPPHERKVCLRFNQAVALVADKLRPDFAEISSDLFLARKVSTVGDEAELLLNAGLLRLELDEGVLRVGPEGLEVVSEGQAEPLLLFRESADDAAQTRNETLSFRDLRLLDCRSHFRQWLLRLVAIRLTWPFWG